MSPEFEFRLVCNECGPHDKTIKIIDSAEQDARDRAEKILLDITWDDSFPYVRTCQRGYLAANGLEYPCRGRLSVVLMETVPGAGEDKTGLDKQS